MAEGNGDVSIKEETDVERTQDYHKLLEYGLDSKVAAKLDEIYQTGKLAHVDLDDRALDALKEFSVEGALNVLTQFLGSNLEHVSNKSAYLCGVMKTYRQKSKAGAAVGALTTGPIIKGPDDEKIEAILKRTGYDLDVTTGQRKYGGPPPNWEGPTPGSGCEVFCGKIPKDMYEDELIPLFEKCGSIWDLRLMMDPMTGQNRGYAFVTFTNKDAAQNAVRELDNHEMKPGKPLKVNISVPNLRLFVGNIPKSKGKEEIMDEFSKLSEFPILLKYKDQVPSDLPSGSMFSFPRLFLQLNDKEIRKGKKIGVTVSFNNHRLFVGNIPKNRDRDDLFEEFVKHAPGLTEVIIYSSPDDKKKNRGFCFLEYESHKAASLAKKRLGTGRIKVWGCDIIVDWADPQEEPDAETMSKVKVLYVRNLTQDCSEEKLKESFEVYGKIDRVKKIKDYAFIHFEDRDNAVRALNELNGKDLAGACIEVSLAKPPSDKKKKEEVLRARERRMMQMMQGRGGSSPNHPGMMGSPMAPLRGPGTGPRGSAGGIRGAAMGRGDYDYDYDYYCYGEYRGGYSDPYYDDYYRYDEYYYDFPPPPPPARGTRSRQALLEPRDAENTSPYLPRTENNFDQAGRGHGVVARGRAGGPPPRGPVRAVRPVATGGRGVVRAPAPRGPLRAKGSLPGKRKFDGGHQTPGETKRRYKRQNNWGSQPLAQQPLGSYVNGGYDQDFYQDTYPSWS